MERHLLILVEEIGLFIWLEVVFQNADFFHGTKWTTLYKWIGPRIGGRATWHGMVKGHLGWLFLSQHIFLASPNTLETQSCSSFLRLFRLNIRSAKMAHHQEIYRSVSYHPIKPNEVGHFYWSKHMQRSLNGFVNPQFLLVSHTFDPTSHFTTIY